MLNWDWVANRPTAPPTPEDAFDPGWWINAKQLLTAPLIDPTVSDTTLDAWLQAHTMDVHHRLLSKLDKVKRQSSSGKHDIDNMFMLEEDEYWEQLQALPRE